MTKSLRAAGCNAAALDKVGKAGEATASRLEI